MSYYKEKIIAIEKIKSMCVNIPNISVDSIKDYIRNTYGFGNKIVHETIDELVRNSIITVEFGIIKLIPLNKEKAKE